MGWNYKRGVNVKRDVGKAREWFKKSAETEHGPGMLMFGVVTRNPNSGNHLQWFKKALDRREEDDFVQGLALAQGYSAGYRSGEMNTEKAVVCLERAMKQGNVEAALRLGLYWFRGYFENSSVRDMYWNGEKKKTTLNKDRKRAFALFMTAAREGCAMSQSWVALSYRKGYGVERNMTQSWLWYRKAASQGLEEALNRMKAGCYQNYERHEKARNGALCLLCCRKFRKSELNIFPMDVMILIAKEIWKTREQKCWK